MKLPIFIKSFILGIIWFLYAIYISTNGIVIIDPCSATPGRDFSNLFLIIPLYIIIFGYLVFFFIKDFVKERKRLFFSIFIISICLPTCCFVLAYLSILFLSENFLREQNIWKYFYEYGCYNDMQTKDIPPLIITTILMTFVLYLIIKRLSKYSNKTNEINH